MLNLLKLVPQLTVASLALLSIFTVGYFSKIGLHLLGIAEVTNIVYSFGLAFGIISIFVMFLNGDLVGFLKRAADDDLLNFLVKGFNRCVVPVLVLGFLLNTLAPKLVFLHFFSREDFLLFLLIVAVLWLLAVVFIRNEVNDIVYGAEIASLAVMIAYTSFIAGRARAYWDVFETKDQYEISTKDASIKNVRLLRSSSSGFIIAVDGTIKFLPKDVVQMMSAQTPLER